MAAGLPLLVGNFPEVRAIVERFGCGACFEPNNPESIASAIRLMLDHERRLEFKAAAAVAHRAFDLDNEMATLTAIYRKLATCVG